MIRPKNVDLDATSNVKRSTSRKQAPAPFFSLMGPLPSLSTCRESRARRAFRARCALDRNRSPCASRADCAIDSPRPAPPGSHISRLLDAVKSLEDVRQMIRWNSHPRILDFNFDVVVDRLSPHLDATPREACI